jgi:hydrogenase maturation protease
MLRRSNAEFDDDIARTDANAAFMHSPCAVFAIAQTVRSTHGEMESTAKGIGMLAHGFQSDPSLMLSYGSTRSEPHCRADAPRCVPVVLGFGNVLLRDDGAGVQIATRLQHQLGPAVADFIDGGTMSFSLLPCIEASDALLVIDAADLGCAPGAVRLFVDDKMDAFLRCTRRRTVHEIGIIDLMDMARLRDCLPRRRALLCIQPAAIDWGEALSEPVLRALPKAEAVARHVLRRWTRT